MSNNDREQINRRIEHFLSRFGIKTGIKHEDSPPPLREAVLSEEELLAYRENHRN